MTWKDPDVRRVKKAQYILKNKKKVALWRITESNKRKLITEERRKKRQEIKFQESIARDAIIADKICRRFLIEKKRIRPNRLQ